MGVARQIRQNGLRSGEGWFGVDEPVLLSERQLSIADITFNWPRLK
ncbi:hypothetical protein GGE12_007460 [Rhizobium mongolense]|uniref:Uncharacterized protein n=1 Tax=Rhizobium mongolense TaxID=57676 RepID=A0A7W6RW05_9HYPH|nr:hypothetical protein [Rhizobium mongolense]